jgi:hypothetical protein
MGCSKKYCMQKKPKYSYTSLYSILLMAAPLGCNQIEAPVRKAKPLNYDTAVIAIFKWDASKYYSFPRNSDPISLTQDELVLMESIFTSAVTEYNDRVRPLLPRLYETLGRKDSTLILINFKEYKRQYFPYKDVNGERIVYINCFCEKYGEFRHWREVEELVDDGGNCYFQLKINLTQKKYIDFFVNGYG